MLDWILAVVAVAGGTVAVFSFFGTQWPLRRATAAEDYWARVFTRLERTSGSDLVAPGVLRYRLSNNARTESAHNVRVVLRFRPPFQISSIRAPDFVVSAGGEEGARYVELSKGMLHYTETCEFAVQLTPHEPIFDDDIIEENSWSDEDRAMIQIPPKVRDSSRR